MMLITFDYMQLMRTCWGRINCTEKLVPFQVSMQSVCCWQGTLQQLLDKKDDTNSQDEVCTSLGELEFFVSH